MGVEREIAKTRRLWRRRRCFRSFFPWAVRIIEFLIQAIVDFLIEDLCHLCGESSLRSKDLTRRSVAAEDRDPSVTPTDHITESLLRPVKHRYLATLTIQNHPICPDCAKGLEPARWQGLLGTIVDRCTVVTTCGEWFAPLARRERRESPRTTDRSRPEATTGEIDVIAPFMTNDNALKIVHLVKFSHHVELAVSMAMAMAAAYRRFGGPLDGVVVPIPMEGTERRRRGFNQSQHLAAVLGDTLGLPVADDSLKKTVKTKRQSKTPRNKRGANVRGAFSCPLGSMSGRHVILVDDLVTTGATVASCAGELIVAGAVSVRVVCFARAL